MSYLLIEESVWSELATSIRRLREKIEQPDNHSLFADDDGLIDNEVVCRYLNISKRTLQYYRERGILPYSFIGNKCYYKSEDIKTILDKNMIIENEKENV